MSHCLQKEIEEIDKIAMEDCTCTSAQQEGIDPTVCRSCVAAHTINDIGEKLRYRLGKLRMRNKS